MASVFFFTVLMITREGVETTLLLVQVRDPAFLIGAGIGLVVTSALAILWARCHHLINLKLFFQVTSLFLLLFLGQVLLSALHELSEAGVLPGSAAFHAATEPFSADGLYGKWFSLVTIVVCMGWLLVAWARQRLAPRQLISQFPTVALSPEARRAGSEQAVSQTPLRLPHAAKPIEATRE